LAIGDVSEGKSADYDGNDRVTPSLRDLVRPSLKEKPLFFGPRIAGHCP
jgi:hypothetical protein